MDKTQINFSIWFISTNPCSLYFYFSPTSVKKLFFYKTSSHRKIVYNDHNLNVLIVSVTSLDVWSNIATTSFNSETIVTCKSEAIATSFVPCTLC